MAAVDIFFYIEPYPLTNLSVIRNKGLPSETVVTPTDTGSSYTVHELEGTFTISADGYITTTEPVHDGMGVLTITLQPVKYISNLSDGTNTYVIKDAEARSSISNLSTVATSGSYNDLSNKPDLTTKANIDLSNITSIGKNIANWSTNVTNCITEIPQDIKLELNNGTLTLKAGSTYYKCDGSFTKVTTSQDYSITNVSNGYRLVFFTGNGFDIPLVQDCNSGTSEPTTGNKWFNTSNYILYSGGSGNWQQKTNYSLPLAIITVSDGTITSIDQVFNGFGYIGSTVFALPGVKGLIPNGRNEDGSLKNIEFTTENVLIRTFSANIKTVTYITSGGIYVSSQRVFDFEKNAYVENGSLVYQTELTKVTTDSNGKITLFRPKLSYRAVDYSDSSWLSGLGMPSSKYIDLTLGASGSIYKAPANGWLFLDKVAESGQWIELIVRNNNDTVYYKYTHASSSQPIQLLMPIEKGRICDVNYTATGTTNTYRFIYAEGEN